MNGLKHQKEKRGMDYCAGRYFRSSRRKPPSTGIIVPVT